jgi:hypothetical protein
VTRAQANAGLYKRVALAFFCTTALAFVGMYWLWLHRLNPFWVFALVPPYVLVIVAIVRRYWRERGL